MHRQHSSDKKRIVADKMHSYQKLLLFADEKEQWQ